MKTAIYQIERYNLKKELSTEDKRRAGRQTFLAEDIKIQESVVVKIIRIEQAIHTADQWIELKLFERESNILKTLNHPALPKYKAAFETDIEGVRSFVLVQTYLEADSLESIIQSGKRFSETEVLEIAKQLLATLNYLHAQAPPVIHRDIKPSNILINSPNGETDDSVGNIYLIDFGSIHTDLTKESDTITIVGSYGYIPLEQFVGQATPASDLYSLGMTLIYLVTGTHPADIARVNGKIQLPGRALQPALARWLEKMTHPDLSRRFGSAQQALDALQEKEQNQSSCESLQPKGTTVVVERERDRIKISTDNPKSYSSVLASIAIIAIWIATIFYAPLSIFIVVPLSIVLKKSKESLFRYLFKDQPDSKWQTVIEIDRKRGIRTGTRKKEQIAVKWGKWTAHFKDIDLLAYNPGYKFDSYTQGNYTISQRGGGVLPELSVHAGELSYSIGHKLSAAEYWWLGQELSDFLGLELQTIYPMPIVTVASKCSGGCGC